MSDSDRDVADSERTGGPLGSVLVVGGGIAGIQASLDCADSGFKVYMLEGETAIGGNMARLDKTFPTNDCAMCMISPKLVEAGRHRNIDIIAPATVKEVEGVPGDFKVTVEKRARFVDEEKCNGCGDCEQACPVRVAKAFDGDLSEKTAIAKLYPQAIPNVFAIEKAGVSPCRAGCPSGVNAHGYVAMIAQGRYADALRLIREANPFVGSCGMVCAHPCEDQCQRGKVDDPIAICSLKRFVFESVTDDDVDPPPVTHNERIAVIGGGPTGMSCAYFARRMGYETTVFEASSHAGGMLRIAIPDFRLPREVVDRDIEWIRKNGVDIRLNTAVGRDVSFEEIRDQYSAVFVCSGAPRPRKLHFLNIPDEGAEGVMYAIEFLKDVKTGKDVKVGGKTVIIGGGHTALDVAMTALQRGADEVTMIELMPEEAMSPLAEEVAYGPDEPITSLYSTTIEDLDLSTGRVSAVHCHRVRFEESDGGRMGRPVPVERSNFTLPADTVVIAIGQYSDLSFLPAELEKTEKGTVAIDPDTLATNCPGIFAGGDVAAGPDVVIKAIAAGRLAAFSIDRYLQGEALGPVQFRPEGPRADPEISGVPKRKRRPLFQSFTAAGRAEVERIAREEAERCLDCGVCSECMECVRVCKPQAVCHDMQDETRDLNVGAIIMASGYDTFDPAEKSEYGFGRYPNVVSSIQFERILSASGPWEGHLQCPSDGRTPKKIAWIQCIGSRDPAIGKDYCSSVCCMYATKQALIAKEHEESVEATIFYTDLRAFGKGFEGFVGRAKQNPDIRFVRSQVSGLREHPENQALAIRYIEEGGARSVKEEQFDMVVLSVGLSARESGRKLAEIAGLECDRFGFVERHPAETVRSGREGVFLCGAVGGPKDIPDTVVESSAAAALCSEKLAAARGTEVRPKDLPPEKDITCVEPRIGVFICHCGTNIASVVDVEDVCAYVQTLGGVVHAQHTLYTCSQDTQEIIKDLIQEKDLNRIIVASCTPRTHDALFKETIREAGLNEYVFEMVNIREQCSWVHRGNHRLATEKAKSLIRGGVAKAHLLRPLELSKVNVTGTGLVIGGGIAGMTAALSLARQGFKTHLVEKEPSLGGNLRRIQRSLDGYDWQDYLAHTIAQVDANENVVVHLSSDIENTSGFAGNFTTKLTGSDNAIEHGVTIVAVGASELKPDSFLYGESDKVVTQLELEERLRDETLDPKRVVMIQCVGSRNEEREYCSKTCCGEAVKNALALKERNPETDVYILYRDMRTYGFKELNYRAARRAGVKFIRFPDDEYPEVKAGNGVLELGVVDAQVGGRVELLPDLLVLSPACVAERDRNEQLAALLKIPLDRDGFFMEAHIKLKPVDFANAGIFVCGLAHSPKYTEENISQALAAAARAAGILSKDSLEVGGIVAVVDQEKCASCLTCLRECAYDAPSINADGKAEIEAAKCQGCGNCPAACPAKAIQLGTFTDEQEWALFEGILGETLPGHMHPLPSPEASMVGVLKDAEE